MLVAALTHKIADAFVHGDARGQDSCGHAGDNAVIARGDHVSACAQDRHQLEHVVIVGSKNRRPGNFLFNRAASHGVQPLHGDQDRKYPMLLDKGLRRFGIAVDVVLKFTFDTRTRFEEIDGAVLAVLVSTACYACQILRNRRADRPDEWMNWTEYKDWCFFVPTRCAQRLPGIFRRMWLKSPRRI